MQKKQHARLCKSCNIYDAVKGGNLGGFYGEFLQRENSFPNKKNSQEKGVT